jgi:bifunctional enzyme CysN/CysC
MQQIPALDPATPAAHDRPKPSAGHGPATPRERLDVVICGHVDHGKSTVIGRLLADTDSLPLGKLEQVRTLCERTARPFEYAFLLDALKDEQAQGITIDTARVFFKTSKRDYIIIDAPGHVEFLKNMITGAARAEAALLVIDAKEGVQENSRRHGYLMSLLGIRQLVVLVNKMDLVAYDEEIFRAIEREYLGFLDGVGLCPTRVIPVSGREGDNIAARSAAMTWYDGPTVLDALDRLTTEGPPSHLPFRLAVQDVYKFTARGDDRRVVAGTVISGTANTGDEVVFYPSGKRSRIKSFEAFGKPARRRVEAGEAVGFTLEEQVYVARGEVATISGETRPHVSPRLAVSLFWLGKRPLVKKMDYPLKIGTARVTTRVEEIRSVIDSSTLATLEGQSQVERHQVAECTLRCTRPVAVDSAEVNTTTGRFVLLDGHEISGGGIVRGTLPDSNTDVRERVLLRNYKWEPSSIDHSRRAARLSQRAALVVITGREDVDRKAVARRLEATLFDQGRSVYFLGIGNVLYGVDADIERNQDNRHEHLRRLAEIAHLLLDSGMILVVTAIDLRQDDLELIKTVVDADRIETIWVGHPGETDLAYDLVVPSGDADRAVQHIEARLHDKRVVFRPW